MHNNVVRSRIIGFVSSLILTMIAYVIILHPEVFSMGVASAITAILSLAVLQAIVQLVFFLNIWQEKGPPWNLGIFISTVLMVLIIIVFSIWIMEHLNYHMMP